MTINIVVSRFGYHIKKSELTSEQYKLLTPIIKPIIIKGYTKKVPNVVCYKETTNSIIVPIYHAEEMIKKHNMNVTYKHTEDNSKNISVPFTGIPRPYQVDLIQNIMKHLETDNRCIMKLATGGGKTFSSLNLLSLIGKKTLIIVHKEFLMHQWLEQIKLFLPSAKVGFIQQNKFEPDADIIIGMLQSLSMREYPEVPDIGLVLIDELPHIASTVFSKALYRYSAKKIIGISADHQRKDGLTPLLDWTLGKTITISTPETFQKVIVKVIPSGIENLVEKRMYLGGLNIQNLTNQLTANKQRTLVIIEQILQRYHESPTNCILIVTDRVAHVKQINEILLKKGIDTAVYIGGMSQDQRDQATKSRVLCATYSMVSEAFDLPKLNTLVMATPKKDINQVVGRILRKQHDENPMIIDVYDKSSVFERWGYARFKFYKKRGYSFQTDVQQHHYSDVDDNEYSNVFDDSE